MIGNHRDAWVYGAVDPGSGTAATLEMCRALGAAVKSGWKPRRTLVYASWDAEEYGLVGSTEWAEEHANEIDEKAVLMLNVDSAVSGHELDIDGVPSLRDLAARRRRRGHRRPLGQVAPRGLDRAAPRRLGQPARPSTWPTRSGTTASRPSSARARRTRRRGSPPDELARLGLGLHGVRRPPGRPGRRRRLQRALRGLSLDLRQLQLDGEVRRPRVPHPRDGRAALHA